MDLSGVKFNENGVITHPDNWTLVDDPRKYQVYVTDELTLLAEYVFEKFNKELYDEVLGRLSQIYPSMIVKNLILENRVYLISIDGKDCLIKFLDPRQIDLDEFFYNMKILNDIGVIVPVKYHGIINVSVYGTQTFGYLINEYVPLEYNTLSKQEKITLFPDLNRILQQVHNAGYCDIDIHGGNFLFSVSKQRLYLIDNLKLISEHDRRYADIVNMRNFQESILKS